MKTYPILRWTPRRWSLQGEPFFLSRIVSIEKYDDNTAHITYGRRDFQLEVHPQWNEARIEYSDLTGRVQRRVIKISLANVEKSKLISTVVLNAALEDFRKAYHNDVWKNFSKMNRTFVRPLEESLAMVSTPQMLSQDFVASKFPTETGIACLIGYHFGKGEIIARAKSPRKDLYTYDGPMDDGPLVRLYQSAKDQRFF